VPEVRLVGVTKRYGDIIAVDNLNLHVKDGEYFTLLGPTGHGKTTTLMIIAGLVKPDQGEVYINGELVNDVPPEDREIGLVFETFSLFPHYNVWKNVVYGPRVKNRDQEETREVAQELLEMVLLASRSDAYPAELSGGMKQRIALARTLAAGSRLLLLDEPFGSLDAKIRMALRREIRNLVKARNLTVLHVTNDTEEAMMVSDRIGVLRKGHVMQVDKPHLIYKKPKNIFVANFLGETSFFEGVIVEVRERDSLVKTENGCFIRILSTDRREGERVVLALRAEYANVQSSARKRVNSFPGRIERSHFLQGFMRYEVKLDGGDLIIALIPVALTKLFEDGDRVTLSFEPKNIAVYPYPKEGLNRILSIE
jgi:ABC-type Fe3+/spermidine/putrescine transport system ATPase subunit